LAAGKPCQLKETEVLVVSSDLDALPQVIDFVRQASQDAGLSDDAVFACELATDEACTNIIDHAYGGRSDGDIRVCCWVQDGAFIVQFHDRGVAFDPSEVGEPQLGDDLAKRPLGGLGMHFMRSLMDEVHFEFNPSEGNLLTMSKRL